MSILLLSKPLIFKNCDVLSANTLHIDFEPSGESLI